MTIRKLTSRSARPGVHVEVVAPGADERRRGTIVDSRTFGPLLDGYHRRLLSEGQVVVHNRGTDEVPHDAAALGATTRGDAILTDAQGRPLEKPRRSDFSSDIAFIQATHAFNDKVAGIANRAFDEGLHTAMARPALPPGTSAAEVELFDTVRSGDKVTIVNRFGQISTGKAVMRGPAGWVLNMGGKHGTPAIASPDNITAVRTPKSKR